MPSDRALSQALRAHAHPVRGSLRDWDPVLDRVGDAKVVLLGEASHGTLQFYRARAEITARLVEEKGFTAVAVEADWPDAWRVNRFVRGHGDDPDPAEALGDFRRFPTWMWRNETVVRFLDWLRARNELRPEHLRAGFYGLDLYSLGASAQAVIDWLEPLDPKAAERARDRYACLHLGTAGEGGPEGGGERYARALALGIGADCEEEVVRQLLELRAVAAEQVARRGVDDRDAAFVAEQNARVVVHAESYYRESLVGRRSSWNLRDEHMAETLERLLHHLGPDARAVVWAHNSHLGDARATEMSDGGELNLGQLCRRLYGDRCVNLGFTTHTGTVTAARDWGGAAETRAVTPSLPGSHERLLHEVGVGAFLLDTRVDAVRRALSIRRPERAIGVVYRPHTERASHYFEADLAAQFDLVVHVDTTDAVVPLEQRQPQAPEPAETWPTGF
jgi:erythromycin esterase-like protein